jgi:hypothetical protein
MFPKLVDKFDLFCNFVNKNLNCKNYSSLIEFIQGERKKRWKIYLVNGLRVPEKWQDCR